VTDLSLEIDGAAASVVIDRPDRRNALTQQMWNALPELIDQAVASPGVRVLVVRSSTSGVFSAGADIGEYRDHIGDVAWGVDNQDRVSRGTRALRECPLPVIAAVDGPAFGAGAGLVVSCDLKVATARSTFAITPAKLGMVYPFPDTAALVETVGASAARSILLTGRTFDAAQAKAWGLLDEVVADDALDIAVERWVALLASNSPTSMRLMKTTIGLAAAGQRDDDERTLGFVQEALEGGDYAEGARAFVERRDPQYP
jgi:enoyl-CoA hydratase/carnithine racemase